MDDAERERIRRWVETWKHAGPELERIKAEQLRAMTDEECLRSTQAVLALVRLTPHEPDASSGLVEQQRLFARARR